MNIDKIIQIQESTQGLSFVEALSMVTSDAYVDVSRDDWYREYFMDWCDSNDSYDNDFDDLAEDPHFASLDNKQLWADVEQWHGAWAKEVA